MMKFGFATAGAHLKTKRATGAHSGWEHGVEG